MKVKLYIGKFLILGTILFFTSCEESREEKERIRYVISGSIDYKKANSEYEKGNFKEAFSLFTNILMENPEQDWLRIKIGDRYKEILEHEKALRCYLDIEDYEQIQEGYRQVYLRIGGAYAQVGKIDSAVFYYHKILDTKPEINHYIGYDLDRESAYERLGNIAFNKEENACPHISL